MTTRYPESTKGNTVKQGIGGNKPSNGVRLIVPALGLLLGMAAGCSSPQVGQLERENMSAADMMANIRGLSRPPRVLLMIDEKSLGTIPTSEVESLAARLLIQENIPVVDQDMVKANIGKGQQLLKMGGDARGMAALGMQLGADVIIMGEAVAKPSARRIAESNLRAYQAVATLRAIRTDNSATLATSSEDASIIELDDVRGSSKALKNAGQKSLDVLIPAMVSAWEKPSPGGATVQNHLVLTVGGVDQMWKLKAVRESLNSQGTVARNVIQRNYTVGVAIFELDSPMPAEELSELLVLKPPAGLKLQVLNISSGEIDLKVVPAQ